MNREKLDLILSEHAKWLNDRHTGKRASLANADLYRANLANANLSHANLAHADLYRADLFNANLSIANLSNADLAHADLTRANLTYANLSHADLTHADLSHANLSHADLRHADTTFTNLTNADLNYAVVLSNTDASDTKLAVRQAFENYYSGDKTLKEKEMIFTRKDDGTYIDRNTGEAWLTWLTSHRWTNVENIK